MNKAVFLDRDGVINEVKTSRVRFVNKPRDFHFLPGVKEAVAKLHDCGYDVFVVTNQGGVGLGYMTEDMLKEIHQHMVDEFEKSGAHIKEVKACTHKPHEDCECRKPKPGMLNTLIEKYHIDRKQSYMIGDREVDIEAGYAAQVTSLMVANESNQAKFSFNDLPEAVNWICEEKIENDN
ncbi:D-glycero-D-manno-heptose 1,7-bisphosphate phosphatase [Alkalibacillus filiformis]|uniref:D,D-heptose 1,7-bisphosphate phosphatase n=1 Tax=Alkalibacillus filiformis TaxID=200990 RepID=A0ABU0DU30_9BACI|nr:HAD family hydrolase [Alkalibacillus filiformis]MDQ0351964.1 D-glycero-D-manno-heptose 1,7-bisphosphate phosphatase [Alkalibacillus filiformis]